jgi:hypothetical protein
VDRSGKVRKRRLIARPRRRAAAQEESAVFQPHLKSFGEGVSGMVLCVPERVLFVPVSVFLEAAASAKFCSWRFCCSALL